MAHWALGCRVPSLPPLRSRRRLGSTALLIAIAPVEGRPHCPRRGAAPRRWHRSGRADPPEFGGRPTKRFRADRRTVESAARDRIGSLLTLRYANTSDGLRPNRTSQGLTGCGRRQEHIVARANSEAKRRAAKLSPAYVARPHLAALVTELWAARACGYPGFSLPATHGSGHIGAAHSARSEV